MNLIFLPEAWEDYLYWQGQDKKTLKRINTLIRYAMRLIIQHGFIFCPKL